MVAMCPCVCVLSFGGCRVSGRVVGLVPCTRRFDSYYLHGPSAEANKAGGGDAAAASSCYERLTVEVAERTAAGGGGAKFSPRTRGGGVPKKIRMMTKHTYCKPAVTVEERTAKGGGGGDLADGRPWTCSRHEGSNLRHWRCRPMVQTTKPSMPLMHLYVRAMGPCWMLISWGGGGI